MDDHQEKINQLLSKLDAVTQKQDSLSYEVEEIRLAINRLRSASVPKPIETPPVIQEEPIAPIEEVHHDVVEDRTVEPEPQPIKKKKRNAQPSAIQKDLEKFIGENLISKIGIVILVIGVGIGAKYSIDHNWIKPIARIILGYVIAGGLLVFGMKLKAKYESFSAVLVSGAIAIMYFITYFGFTLYGFFGQVPAFILMVIFTGFAVVASIQYARQVIAHIGLVGAYGVPFLLSNGSGEVVVLFSYMALLNAGILAVSFWRYWKGLCYTAFGLTWLIYAGWYLQEYSTKDDFAVGLIFLSIFFLTFYMMILAYKLIKKEKLDAGDILVLLANSFLFFGYGCSSLISHEIGEQLLGLFALANAIIHFAVCTVVYRQKLADRNLFYLLTGLVMVYITIAIPVQLDGHWVTLLWAGEAALLFWIGRSKAVKVYEGLSYPLILLTMVSIGHDWVSYYWHYHPDQPLTWIMPILNIQFSTTCLVVAALSFINLVHWRSAQGKEARPPSGILTYSLGGTLILIMYLGGMVELTNYWDQLYKGSVIANPVLDDCGYSPSIYHKDIRHFSGIWVFNYTLVFLIGMVVANLIWIRSKALGIFTFIIAGLTILLTLTQAPNMLAILRVHYISQYQAEYYHITSFNIGIRYTVIGLIASLLGILYIHSRKILNSGEFRMAFDALLYLSGLIVASLELIHWEELAGEGQSYKLGLSILWGAYSLIMIALGIWLKKKHLRIGAIVLFGITLVKLFLYDISHLDTIAKTVVFVSLGSLLLVISFLYNKYQNKISNETDS